VQVEGESGLDLRPVFAIPFSFILFVSIEGERPDFKMDVDVDVEGEEVGEIEGKMAVEDVKTVRHILIIRDDLMPQ